MLEEKLAAGIGQNILVMTEAYPFFYVGKLEYVTDGQIGVNVQFGVPVPLQNQVFNVRINAISAFYFDSELGKIPATW
ncbi:hypothetical protein lbkm_2363 [Lachnospiraceae bacterium KM106-2]|nr:hypothetical protein lbkm_2363 [Lachnospiraceae bacterium KM106-2]